MSLASVPPFDRAFAFAERFLRPAHNRSMVWSIADQFLVSAANFAVGIVAARLAGVVAEFGQFTLILMLAALAGVFIEYIFCAPMMTLAGRAVRRSPSYYAAVTLLSLGSAILGALAVTLVIGGLLVARDGHVTAVLLGAAFVVTFGNTVQGAVRRVLFAQRQSLTAFSVDIGRFTLYGVAVGFLYIEGVVPSAELMLAILGATGLLAVIPSLVGIFRARLRKRLLWAVVHRHWPIARWLVLMAVVAIGQEQIIWVIVSLVLGDAAVGGMRAGQYLLGVTHFIMLALENFVPRGASDAYGRGDAQALKRFLIRQTVMLGAPTFALLAFVALPAEIWLGWLFGPDYVAFAPVLWVWSVAYVVIFIREMWVYYLRTIEQTRGTFHAFALSSAVSVVLIYPAITWFGVVGAALVVCIAHTISMVYILALVARHLRDHQGPQPASAASRPTVSHDASPLASA